jgi:hypothetical protein
LGPRAAATTRFSSPGPYAAPTLSAVLTDGTAPLAGVTALTRVVLLAA